MLRIESKLNKFVRSNGIYRVNNVEELQKIIQIATEEHLTVRTVGSQHSPAASIYSNSKREIKIKLEGELSQISSFEVDDSKDTALVRVGAGCHLGRDPQDSTSTWENSFNYQVHQRGYALSTLGGITHQTVAGMISTSSNGGSAKHGIADSIEEIEFVDGNNKLWKTKKGEELFNAVGVSMGLLGVLTHVTFRLQKKFLVQGSEINQEVQDSCLAGDEKSDYAALDKVLFEDNEYVHINLFAQKYVNRISLWTGRQSTDFEAPQVPYKHALNADSIHMSERLQGQIIRLVGGAVLHITNLLNEKCGDYNFIQHLMSIFIKPFVNPSERQDFNGPSHQILPIDDQAPVHGMIETTFCELWFPREQLSEVIRRLKKIFAEHPSAAGNFLFELYPAKKSPFMLSPSQGGEAFRVDFYWRNGNCFGTPSHFFGLFSELWTLPGCLFHPGKWMPTPGETYNGYTFQPEDLQKNYTELARFLQIRDEMDPLQIFTTRYWRNLFSIHTLPSEMEYKEQEVDTRTVFSSLKQRLLPKSDAQEVVYNSFAPTR